jgi:hypothetical protein
MPAGESRPSLIPPDWPLDVQPTDDSGEVDLSLIDHTLSLTLDQRIEEHYRARRLVEQLREAGRRIYGPAFPDPEAAD